MSNSADKLHEKKNRLARNRSVPAAPVASIFIAPPEAEPTQPWNVRLPQSLALQLKQAILTRTAASGKRVTAREITVEALEAWLEQNSH